MELLSYSLLIKQRLHIATSLLRIAQRERQAQTELLQAVCLSLWQTVQCLLAGLTTSGTHNAPWHMDVRAWCTHNQQHPCAQLFSAPWLLQLEALHAQLYTINEPSANLATTTAQLKPQLTLQLMETIATSLQECMQHIMEHQHEC